jgi:sulfite reductase (NADPH) flavoprotein alpha-component
MTYQIVPESAPFNSEQRAWLNGFLAGMLGVVDDQSARGGSSSALAAAAELMVPSPGSFETSSHEESFPWHDASLVLADRMKLADGKPVERRLMAAMAQLNCGSCGYLCQTYAEAIATGSEKNLTLCSPGGSDTAKMVRLVLKENRSISAANPLSTKGASDTQTTKLAALVGTRDNPVTAKLVASDRLNGPGSAKDTRHVAIDLSGTTLKYQVGDALGVWPTNCQELVDRIAAAANLRLECNVVLIGETGSPLSQSLGNALLERCVRGIPDSLLELAIETVKQRPKQNGSVATDANLVAKLEEFAQSDEMFEWDVLEFLEAFPTIPWNAQSFAETLVHHRPRLYSIASSQTKYADQVHLTVGRVEKEIRGRARKGVASTMFADRLKSAAPLRVFIHPSHGFTVPSDPTAPMIMVGPGTGIAPFMAFLQQREADQSTGKNWLFFGDQRQACDFLYRDQLIHWQSNGLLTRLDLAFSRDHAEKVYVQNRMIEQGAELFAWLEQGGYFFVCGDASRMATDVDKALHQVIATHGKKSEQQAKEYVLQLSDSKRYVRDVY